jgi:peptide/nickel transport system substrate-binding protein
LRWSDGAPITAQDVAYTWRVIMDPKDPAVLSTDGYSDISRIDIPDALTFTLHFDRVYPQYLSLFNAVLPEHRLRNIPADRLASDPYWLRPDVVSGPFLISELVPDDHLVLTRNTAWTEGRAGRAPHLTTIVYRIYPELGQLVDAAKAGQVDLALEIPDDALASLNSTGKTVTDYTGSLAYEQVTFNQEDPNPLTGQPPLWKNDPLLLQALRLAVDRQQLVRDLLGGKARVADSPIPSALTAYHRGDVPITADLKRANQLLDADGWKRGADGIRRYGGRPLAFSLTAALGDPLRLAVQDRLVQAWQALGAQVTVRDAHPGDLFSGYAQGGMLEHGLFEAGLWTWSIGSDPDGVYPIEDSTQIPTAENQGRGANFGRFESRVIDRNLDWGRSSLNPADRVSAYAAFEAAYARLGAELPLYERVVAVLATPRLHNLEVNPGPDTTLWNAADWWLG